MGCQRYAPWPPKARSVVSLALAQIAEVSLDPSYRSGGRLGGGKRAAARRAKEDLRCLVDAARS